MRDQENRQDDAEQAQASAEVKSVKELSASQLEGKVVLVRCDFNIPLKADGTVIDDLRIRKTVPTIECLRSAGARIVLISHIENKDGLGLEPVAKHVSEKHADAFGTLGRTFSFVQDFLGDESARKISEMQNGSVILFENLRVNEGEKKNDLAFAQKLLDVTGAEFYVNDAFAVSHRAHASVVALPSLFAVDKRFAGIQMMNEIKAISLAFNSPRPFIFILGGAKFESKLPLIKKFSTGEKSADAIVLGGALLNDVLKAKGFEVGKSLVSSGLVDISDVVNNESLIIPSDVVVMAEDGAVSVKKLEDVLSTDVIYDAGPSVVSVLAEKLADAKFVLWNGPMGNYEKGFKDQTVAIAKLVDEASKNGTHKLKAILGGGDTTAAVAELGLDDDSGEEAGEPRSMFVSTGGGAMLEYLLNESLPGIEALK